MSRLPTASSRRLGSQGAARKTAREKIEQARREEASSRHAFFYFFARGAPQLPKRLEEARLPKVDSASFNRVNI